MQQAQPIFYDVHCEVSKGSVKHPQMPLALEDLKAKLHCTAGVLQMESLTARSGATLIADPARGRLLLFAGQDRDGRLGDLWVLAGAPQA